MKFSKSLFFSVALVYCMNFVAASIVMGQDKVDKSVDQAAEAANSRLVEVLDKTDGLFYKSIKRESGTIYTIKWEQDGEISNINLILELQGTYDSKPVFALFGYSTVAESEKAFPPAVIKLVPVKSDNSRLSSFIMNETLTTVYVKTAMPSDTLTAGQLWMTCVHLHRSRTGLKKEIAQILSGAAK